MRVVVIGAGVGGLTLAVALHRGGVRVSVHERSAAAAEAGNGLGLSANGVRVLAGLGLDAALRGVGAPIPSMRMRTAAGAELARYDVGAGGLLGVRRADLLSVLADAVPDGVLHRGQDCVGVRPGDGSRASAEFADGTVLDADLVVGADGARSTAAQHVTRRPPPRDSGRVALRGFVPAAGIPTEVSDTQIAWLGDDRHLLTFPVGHDGTLLVSGFVPRGIVRTRDPDALVTVLRDAFGGWNADVAAVVGRADAIARYDLADRDPFGPWSRGRVCLLGDAAHPMLPHGGQGANQAIEDAAVLATLLTGGSADRAPDVPAALAAYEALRRPRTARVQDRSRRNGELFSGGTASRPGTGESMAWIHGYDALSAARDALADHDHVP